MHYASYLELAMTLLQFQVGPRHAALPLRDVVEVVRAVAIVPLQSDPQVVEGVFDLRGQLVPLVDLRALLGLPPRRLLPSDQFVVARAGERIVGLRADTVVGLLDLEAGELDETADLVASLPLVSQVARTAEGLLLILDLHGFLGAVGPLPSAAPEPMAALVSA